MMMTKRGRSFVAIMITVSIVALFLRFFIEQLIKINIVQNESYAQDTLKLVSTAFENYAKDHQGSYPVNMQALSENNPPYIDKKYMPGPYIKGYSYSCNRLEATGYSCSSVPAQCNLTGKKSFVVTTGGALVSEDCSKKKL